MVNQKAVAGKIIRDKNNTDKSALDRSETDAVMPKQTASVHGLELIRSF